MFTLAICVCVAADTVKLPFVDKGKLLDALKSVAHELTPEEVKLNTFGTNKLFVHEDTSLAKCVIAC